MVRKVSFSGQHLDLSEISHYYWDLDASVRLYFSPESPRYDARFAGYLLEEVAEEMEIRLGEHGRTTAFSVLAAIEAAFRIDYLQRCYRKEGAFDVAPPDRDGRGG